MSMGSSMKQRNEESRDMPTRKRTWYGVEEWLKYHTSSIVNIPTLTPYIMYTIIIIYIIPFIACSWILALVACPQKFDLQSKLSWAMMGIEKIIFLHNICDNWINFMNEIDFVLIKSKDRKIPKHLYNCLKWEYNKNAVRKKSEKVRITNKS